MKRIAWIAGVALSLGAGASRAQDCNDGSGKCKVDVKVSGTCPNATITFEPDTLKLKDRHQWEIIWSLPNGYAFCLANGDRLLFTDYSGNPDFQFKNMMVDGPTGNCYTKLSVEDKNEPWTANRPAYEYKLQFTSPTNTMCLAHPFIKNG